MKKVYKFLLSIAVLTIVSFGEINPLLKGKSSKVVDIGLIKRTNYIEVPMSMMYFSPTMQIVNNIIIYSNRNQTTDSCIVDKFNIAGCPIEQEECTGNLEYTNGSSQIGGTGNISCSTIDPISYYDGTRNKCVLPAPQSKVCEQTINYKYQISQTDYYLEKVWYWCSSCSAEGSSGTAGTWFNTILPIITKAGGTSISAALYQNSYTWKVTTDIKKPIYIQAGTSSGPSSRTGNILTINPGDYFYIYKNNSTIYIKDKNNYLIGNNSTRYIFTWQGSDTRKCNTGEQQIMENGVCTCVTDEPIDVIGTYNPTTDKCMASYQHSAIATPARIKAWWWWCDSCQLSGIPPAMLSVIQAAGGTSSSIQLSGTSSSIQLSGTSSSIQLSGTSSPMKSPKYLFSTNATKPITILLASTDNPTNNMYAMVTYSPGDILYLVNASRPYLIHNGTKHFTNGSTTTYGGIDKPTLYFMYNNTSYSCNPGETLLYNGGNPICDGQIDYEAKCTSSTFGDRSHDECVTDILHYQYYNYQCPSDVNKYGSSWFAYNPGGDCGGGNDGIDTNGDGIKDFCNNSTPPENNCYRSNYKCSINPNNPCIFMEKDMDYNDFSKWEIINLSGNATDSEWSVTSKNNVTQTKDTNPSFFLSNYTVQDNGKISISGIIKTDNIVDNDWFGFVFGYKGTNDFYLLDWSKKPNDLYEQKSWFGNFINRDAIGNPINGAIPLTLSKIKSLPTYQTLWNHSDNSSMSILQRKDNGGWIPGQKYNVKIEIEPHNIKVYMGKIGEAMSLDIDHTSSTAIDFTGKLGFYNYSLGQTSYEDFLIEWENGDSVASTIKKPLINHGSFTGSFKGDEYGNEILTRCAPDYGICRQSLSSITADSKTLTFKDKQGVSGDVVLDGDCTFSGEIKEQGIDNKLLYSFLNSPDESLNDPAFQKDYNSPTRVSLNFNDMPGYIYPLKQVKTSANKGDQITVDFWLNWRGNAPGITANVPLGFYYYDIYLSSTQNIAGFSTSGGDVYGISNANNIFGNNWVKVTAILTHQDLSLNKLYINGVSQSLSQQTPSSYDNLKADITQVLNLGGITGDPALSVNGKIAGVNVYDGALDSNEINRAYSSSNRGINRLEIDRNKIIGYDSEGNSLGTITSSCLLSGKVGYLEDGEVSQIVAAKTINGRLEFWDSYNLKGNIGFIEAIKTVNSDDASNGYLHEFVSFKNLYDKGFTGFRTVGGNTYAVSTKAIDTATCLSMIKDTGYFLAQRIGGDLDNINTINSLSYYTSGDYKDHCVIEKHAIEDNLASEYAIKTTIKQKTKGHFVCSPYGCNNYKCGYASCPPDTNGTIVRDVDRDVMPADTCYGQKCDISKSYFPYCGNPNSCNTADPSVMKTDDGKCKQASCPADSKYNAKLGKCEKLGCKYELKDNRCYKKAY